MRGRRRGCRRRKTKLGARAARFASRDPSTRLRAGLRGGRRHTSIGHASDILPSFARPDRVRDPVPHGFGRAWRGRADECVRGYGGIGGAGEQGLLSLIGLRVVFGGWGEFQRGGEMGAYAGGFFGGGDHPRSEEHTSELQSLTNL